MKVNPAWLRRIGLGLLALALLAAMAYVLTRTGPLAPTRITVTEVAAGRLQPSIFGIGTVEAQRSGWSAPRWPAACCGGGGRGRHGAGRSGAGRDGPGGSGPAARRAGGLDCTRRQQRSQCPGASGRRHGPPRLAEINAKRNQDLADQNFISAGALEARQQEKLSADAAVLAARANLQGQGQERQRLVAEQQALAQQRSNVRLVASTAGVVVSREAEPGTTVVAGQAVLRLVDPASLWVKLRVDQGRSAGLAAGLPAQIVLRSRPAAPVPGQVARVELQADSVTEERVAQVAFDSLPRWAWPWASWPR